MHSNPVHSDTDAPAVRSFVDRFARDEPNAAVDSLLEAASEPRSVLTSLFGVGYDSWYALVADDISGHCLDCTPGWGRTTPLLLSLADRVSSYQPTDTGRRLLESRPELDGADVVSIVGDDIASAIDGRSFDTVVATGPRPPDREFFDHVDRLAASLADGGTLVTEIDGWPRTSGVTDLVGLESESERDTGLSPTAVWRSIPSRFVAALETRGFDDVDLFGLLPGGSRYRWAVPADDPDAIEWVLDSIETDSTGSGLVRRGATLATELGLVAQSYPSYVAVCRTDSSAESDAPSADEPDTTRVLRRGANRSIVFELSDGDVETVRKVPNTPTHSRYNERAASTLSELTASGEPIAGTLPDVALEESALGPVLSESPASGTPLMDVVTRWPTPPDPDAFVRVLETGLGWIRTLQLAHAGPRRRRSPGAARRELAPDRFDVAPPTVSDPLEFPAVPAHGDYHPGNVLVADDGSIERVIDWEYSALESNPAADPGFFTLKLAAFAFGGFETGVRATLLEDTPYSVRVAESIVAYCDAIGIRPRTFATYLGHSLVRQIDVHFETGSPWRFHANPREKVDRLSVLYDGFDEIRRRLGDARAASAGGRLSPTVESPPLDPETPVGQHPQDPSTDFDAPRDPGQR
ncbi:phosphotransferase [Natrinema caseinilyticum]|uniref:phosphotransferase n=1 Tax=Natrinema caseinilyticum TaxID=2961570 RepID=UPI0020C5936C|nr:phosphotransferase [Natrinema caseinilyticum]